jgi:nucleotide-binding universal stress UspA family protein
MMEPNSNSKQRFLVLMDFSEASYIGLKYAISLSKLLKAEIAVLHVASPSKMMDSYNPSVVARAINADTIKNQRKLNSIKEIIETEGIEATSHYSIGDKIDKLEEVVKETNPDLVVIGNKGKKSKFSGKLTGYLMRKYAGSLLLVGDENEFQPTTKISLGCNGDTLSKSNPEMIFSLNKHTETPITLVEVKDSIDSNPQKDLPNGWKSLYEMDKDIQFECQNNSNVVTGLVNYISQNNIKLLCIGRGKQKKLMQRMFSNQNTIAAEVADQVNIPILVMGLNSNSSTLN